MNKEVLYKDKLEKYTLSDLIQLRYTMNSSEYPELYQELIYEIKKRKEEEKVNYYGFRQFINNETFKTVLNKFKVIKDIKTACKNNSIQCIYTLIISPFKFILSLIHLFLFTCYNYYYDSKYTRDIAYFSSVLALMAVIFINLLTVVALLKLNPKIIVLWNSNAPRWEQYLQILLYYSPFYFLINSIFPEQKVLKQNYDGSFIFLGKVFVICYSILSFTLFVISVLLKNS